MSATGVVVQFLFPGFDFNARADRLSKFATLKYTNKETPDRWLDLCGPTAVAKQFILANEGICTLEDVPSSRAHEWSHRIHFPNGMPAHNRKLAELLKEVLSLTTREPVDCAIALDWYKQPDPEVDPMSWPNTEAGELNRRSKYFTPGYAQATARRELIRRFADLISRHPLYRDAPTIITVPGHKANGKSHGEQFASKIAEVTGKELVSTLTPGGARPPSKEAQSAVTAGLFAMPRSLEGDVVIIDDVYRSGSTMRAVAGAARSAGATRIFGLAIVRTMRN